MQRLVWLSSLILSWAWASDTTRVAFQKSEHRTLYAGLEQLSNSLPRVWWDRQWVSACRPKDIRTVIEPVRITLEDPEKDFYFVVPIRGYMGSGFGYRWGWQFHFGFDVSLRVGDTVVAAMDGEVRLAGYDPGGYGYYCVIAHPNGTETVYGHFSRVLVTKEQIVKAGDPVGLGGSTGYSTGPHLHFELRFMGEPVNLSGMIDFSTGTLLQRELVLDKSSFAHLGTITPASLMRPHRYGRRYATSAGAAYHTVRSGESLYSISRRYGVTVGRLAALNGISAQSVIRPGQRLRVR